MSETEDILKFEELTLLSPSAANFKKENASRYESNPIVPIMTEKLEAEAFKSIHLIGYEAPLSENDFKKALEEGPKSIQYTKLISFLTNELRVLCNIDEHVNAISTPEDSVSFIMETSSFLNELGCPYTSLTRGHVSERLSTILDRILLIQHLVGELMANRILKENRPDKKIELKLQESSQAADLRKMLQTLGFPKPPANISMQALIQKLIPTIQGTVQKAGSDLLGNPIFNGTLSPKQWDTLATVQQELHEDYHIRRQMLLKRLDCTIQSFQWSDKTKGKEQLFNKSYVEKRELLKAKPEVDLSDLLASRDDLAIIEKTSSAAVRKHTKSAINKVIIGQVPDRGGRTSEQAPPPPEMPPWQQRSGGPGGGGGFRGGQRGGSNFSRGGGGGNNFSRGGGGGNNFSRGGGGGGAGSNNFGGGGNQRSFDSAGSYGGDSSSVTSRGGSNYSRGTSNYSRGTSDYSRGGGGGNEYSRGGGNDYSRPQSASSFSQDNNRGSTDYSRPQSTRSYSTVDYSGGGYSQGSGGYSRGYSQSDTQSSSGGYSQQNKSRSSGGGYSDRGTRGGGFDSAGGYGSYSQDYQEPKRAKTYDQFQQSRTTYADQYVQESQHNQQYNSRDDRDRGNRGGRSNYSRGGGGGYR